MADFFELVGQSKKVLDDAEDCAVVNGCLILKKEQYDEEQFKERNDIIAVYAPFVTVAAIKMFYDSSNIQYAYFPNMIEAKGWSFCGCSKLKQLIAPKLNKFGDAAFGGCPCLDLSIYYPITQEQIDNTNDGEVINFHLILKNESYPEGAFKNRHDILFVHAKNLKVVSKQMFYGCKNIQTIDSSSVEVIEEEGFYFCNSLKLFESEKLTSILYRGFENCWSLAQLISPNLTKIGEKSLFNCALIKTLNFPCLVEVKKETISGCTKLNEFNAPKLNQYGEAAFERCYYLDLSKNFPITQEQIERAKDGEIINHHLILKSESYQNRAFQKRHDIFFVHAKNLKLVSIGMFVGCSNLQEIDSPLVEVVEESGFEDCVSLKSFKSQNLTSINKRGFYHCITLTKLETPQLNYLDHSALWLCSLVDNIVFSCLKEAKENAFMDCNMRTFIAPELETLEQNAFKGCEKLELIYTPKLNKDQFQCKGCYSWSKCPVCKDIIDQCLQKGSQEYPLILLQNKLQNQEEVNEKQQQEIDQLKQQNLTLNDTLQRQNELHAQQNIQQNQEIDQLKQQYAQQNQEIEQLRQLIHQLQENFQNYATIQNVRVQQQRNETKVMTDQMTNVIKNLK